MRSAPTHPAVSRNWQKRIALSPLMLQVWTNGTSRCLRAFWGTTHWDVRAANDLGVRSLWADALRDARAGRGRRPPLRRRPGLRALLAADDHVVGRDRGSRARTRCSTCSTARGARSSTGTRTSSARAPRSSSHATWPGSSTARCAPSRCWCTTPSRRASRTRSSTWTTVETGTATAGRQFLLGVTPEQGCASVTQFIGLVPPGRAPDHFHTYDEVIYVLDGEGTLFIGGEQGRAAGRARASTCLPASSTAWRTRARASCACSASSGRPARRPRPITPTAHLPSHQRRPPSAEDRTHLQTSAGKGTSRVAQGRITAEIGRLQRTAVLAADPDRAGRREDEPGGAARRGARGLLDDVARDRADRGRDAADAHSMSRARS